MPLPMILVMVAIIGVGVFIILNASKPKKQQQAQQSKTFKKIYGFLSRNFITQGSLNSIYSRLANLSIYRRDQLQTTSVKYFLMAWGISGGLVLASFFLFSDFLSVLICFLFALLLNNALIDKNIDKVYLQVLLGLSKTLGSIRQEYMRLNNVVEAINEADTDALLKKPIDEIYTILISTEAEIRLQEFYEATPFRTIQTLGGICYNINNQGDEVDNSGQSNFVQALTLMSSDVNSEIERLVSQKKKFGMIEYLPFVPILTMGLLESYFMGIMPGTALIYKGPLGYLLRTLTVVLSIVAYTVVSRINMNVPVKEDDRGSIVISLLEKSWIKRFIHNIKPKGRAELKIQKKLKDCLSRMSIEQFYVKKVLAGILAFVLAILTSISTVSLGEDFIRTATQQLSLVATGEMDKYSKEQIQELDAKYLAMPDSTSEDTMKSLIKGYMPGLTDLQIIDQVKRLKDKRASLENAYYKWWYIWICAGVGVLGWFGPNIMLGLRKMLIQTEAEDDFLQLQTLVSILMNTGMDTLDVLHQLSQHSRIHKDMLLYCYHSYPSNPERELSRLQAKTPIIEFKRFVGKLKLTISDLSLREAFSDLIIEREHILRLRQMSIQDAIAKKRGFCGPLTMVPIGAMVIGELLVPLGILGFKEFMGALSGMK